jgi:ribosome-binding factor A
MRGRRTDRFEKQMLRDLSEIFVTHSREWFNESLVSVSDVKTSPDLGYLKIYLSLYNVKNKSSVMEKVSEKNKEIRMELARKIRNDVRKIPELTFFEDPTIETMNRIDSIFEKLRSEEDHEKPSKPE